MIQRPTVLADTPSARATSASLYRRYTRVPLIVFRHAMRHGNDELIATDLCESRYILDRLLDESRSTRAISSAARPRRAAIAHPSHNHADALPSRNAASANAQSSQRIAVSVVVAAVPGWQNARIAMSVIAHQPKAHWRQRPVSRLTSQTSHVWSCPMHPGQPRTNAAAMMPQKLVT